MITRVLIRNYKVFASLDLHLSDNPNTLVGDNEVGKSTVLEAISLTLTKRLNGRPLEYELTPHLFNKAATDTYLRSLQVTPPGTLPSIVIELYLSEEPAVAHLRGTMNADREDSAGVRLEVSFDEEYAEEYEVLLRERRDELKTIPAEYYFMQLSLDSPLTHVHGRV